MSELIEARYTFPPRSGVVPHRPDTQTARRPQRGLGPAELSPRSAGEELVDIGGELFVVLEEEAVGGVGVDLDFRVGQQAA